MRSFLILFVTMRLCAAAPEVQVFKTATCGCCKKWVEHLKSNGFAVNVTDVASTAEYRKKYRVPDALQSCHTAIVNGYSIEGHVPATIVRKLLKERPPIRGISLPGMPDGSPGMTGQKTEPFVIYEFGDSGSKVYARE